jgi:repressor of nif and glnA expression
MTSQQIALITVEPEPRDLKTVYECMIHVSGGMAGTSVVYENGFPLEHTRRNTLLNYKQYENLKKLGRIR